MIPLFSFRLYIVRIIEFVIQYNNKNKRTFKNVLNILENFAIEITREDTIDPYNMTIDPYNMTIDPNNMTIDPYKMTIDPIRMLMQKLNDLAHMSM